MEYIQKKRYLFEKIVTNHLLQLSLLYILLFLTPFILKGPQLLQGSIVNFLLIIGITQFKFKEIVPALLLPSIASYTYGVLFGSATIFLTYLIPFIFLSNIIYILVFKNLKKGYINVFVASLTKALFLFISTYILFKTVGLPEIFLTSMGIIQFFTAIIGATVASKIVKI